MQEVVESELQIVLMLLSVLLTQLLLRLTDQCEVAVPIEVVIRLQQDYVVATPSLLVVERLDCLEILLLEVLMLELHDDLVLFLQLVEPLSEYSKVSSHFFCRLCFDLRGYAFQIIEVALLKCFEELLVVRKTPLSETSRQHPVVLNLDVFRNQQERVYQLLDFLAQ